MPPPEEMYRSEEIKVPRELPDILKQFTKAAIRTQPPDVLAWTAAYFTALSRGDSLPVKRKLEPGETGLTAGLLDVLYQQLNDRTMVNGDLLSQKWRELGLPARQFQEIMAIGKFVGQFEFLKFFAVACSQVGEKSITQAMRIICQILTEDSDGSAYPIPFDVFTTLFTYLSSLNQEISQAQIDAVLSYLKCDVKIQGGMVIPRNFLSPDCPSLS